MYNFCMLYALLIFITYFGGSAYYDNALGGDFMANAFAHTEAAKTASYDNPAILGVLDNIYALTTITLRKEPTFYIDTKARPRNSLIGIISPRISLFYRNIFDLNRRIDTPYFVDRERYSEYTLGLSSSNKTASLGLNIKYLTATYAYAYNDSILLDFAKGFSQDIGLLIYTDRLTIGAAYDHIYGILKWDSGEKTRIPSRYFVNAEFYPFKNLLYLSGEYEKFLSDSTAFWKGGILFNIPYKPGKVEIGIYGGYLKADKDYLITYGFNIQKGVVRISTGFDTKGNITLTLYSSGE